MKGVLQKAEFYKLVMIVENRVRTATYAKTATLFKARQELLKKADGFKSAEYLQKLVSDVAELAALRDEPLQEVLQAAKVNEVVMEASWDKHVGDEQLVDTNFVRRNLETYQLYPVSATGEPKEHLRGLEIYTLIMKEAIERLTAEDTLGLFKTISSYIECFDLMCVDLAWANHGMMEADFRFMVSDLDLTEERDAQVFYKSVSQGIQDQIEWAEQEEDRKQAEAAEMMAEAKRKQ